MKKLLVITAFLLKAFPALAFASEKGVVDFPVWSCVFFIGLLLCIGICPLVNGEWWGRRYGAVSIALAVPAATIVLSKDPHALLTVLEDYISFIILLGSLFIIAGGIIIRINIRGTPKLNCLLLLIGAFFASFIGTTGASMVLIRPLLRVNKWRKHVVHIYVFFIFLVSNIGGLLTPLGDPPLFLGFLKGVPFVWTFKLLPFWLFAVGILLAVFFFLDSRFMKKEEAQSLTESLAGMVEQKLEIRGKLNFIFLLMVIGAFFLPPLFRELAMIVAAGFSIAFTPGVLREENAFTYHPIIEVALLFIGIFITMVPMMKILAISGSRLGVTEPWQFFWASGSLSSFLDNAPTYLVFLTTAQSVAAADDVTTNLIAGVPEMFLRAVSVGSVFMGANSYIGNGPNFMVKSICEENDIQMPSFFGYMAWSMGILIPLFIVITIVFF